MTARSISLRMSEEKIRQVDSLAKTLGRSRAWIINQATDRYLAYESWFAEQVEQGLTEAEAGKTASHNEVMAGLRERIAKGGK
ncbi:MAG TPA: ribbon-helix-helix protein, CopG family [Gammaproteobacteria bacterium]|nr:ribbon-helix-helix protein, CopG family [Gammaproteobacteria bacterium]